MRKLKIKRIANDLTNTLYLKTAMIENECIKSLNSDIFVGPKYHVPLIESISFKFFIFFFTVPD